MFEKFTDKARKVISLAQDEARSLGQMYVGTEHLLLGLIKEKEGIAAQAMIDNGQLPQLVEVAIRAKASDWLAKNAVDTAGEHDEAVE